MENWCSAGQIGWIFALGLAFSRPFKRIGWAGTATCSTWQSSTSLQFKMRLNGWKSNTLHRKPASGPNKGANKWLASCRTFTCYAPWSCAVTLLNLFQMTLKPVLECLLCAAQHGPGTFQLFRDKSWPKDAPGKIMNTMYDCNVDNS